MLKSLFDKLQESPLEIKGWYRGNKHLKQEKIILSKDELTIYIRMTNDDRLTLKEEDNYCHLKIEGKECGKMKEMSREWIHACYEDYLKRKGWKMI